MDFVEKEGHCFHVHVCMFLFEFASTHGLQDQLHGSECDNGVIKKKGGGRRRTVAKRKGGQFRSKIDNCTNMRVPETEGTCGAIKC